MILSMQNEVQQLIDIIHEQNSIYVSIMLAILAAFIGFQWFLNDKQAKSIEQKTEKEILEKYILPIKSDLNNVTQNVDLYTLKNEFITALNLLGEFDDSDINDSLYIELKEDIEKICNLSKDRAYKFSILATLLANVSDRIEKVKEQGSSNVEILQKLKSEMIDQITKYQK